MTASQQQPIKRLLVPVDDEHIVAAQHYLVSRGKKPTRRNTVELLGSWAYEGLNLWAQEMAMGNVPEEERRATHADDM